MTNCYMMKKVNYDRFISRVSAARKESPLRKCSAIAVNNPDFLSLATGLPNPDMFPFRSAQFKTHDGTQISFTGNEMKQALQYNDSVGVGGLLEWVYKLQKKYHDPPLMSQAVDNGDFAAMITSGSQDGLSKIFAMVASPGDSVLISSPCYPGVLSIVRPCGYNILPVEADEHGMRTDSLLKVMQQWKPEDALDPESNIPKVLYTIPSCGNPTGVTTSLERKQRIYEIARTYDMLIVEDDPYFFLQFGELVPSYQSIDVDGRVLRSDSMSKVMSSGLRLGWISGAKPFVERLVFHQQATVVHSSTLGQMLVNSLLNDWGLDGFETHIKNVQSFYETQRNAILMCLNKHMKDLAEWNVPQGGMFVWIKLKGIDDTQSLIEKRALEKKVILLPGTAFEVEEGKKSSFFRASYSFAKEEEMDEALKRLADLIQDEIKTC